MDTAEKEGGVSDGGAPVAEAPAGSQPVPPGPDFASTGAAVARSSKGSKKGKLKMSERPAAIDFEPGCKWLGLEVRRARSTGPDAAEVEFVARSRTAGRAQRLHERSRFVREDGRWYYLDGDLL